MQGIKRSDSGLAPIYDPWLPSGRKRIMPRTPDMLVAERVIAVAASSNSNAAYVSSILAQNYLRQMRALSDEIIEKIARDDETVAPTRAQYWWQGLSKDELYATIIRTMSDTKVYNTHELCDLLNTSSTTLHRWLGPLEQTGWLQITKRKLNDSCTIFYYCKTAAGAAKHGELQ
jgi:hypothetical protein